MNPNPNLNESRAGALFGALRSPRVLALLLVALTLTLYGPAAGFEATNCDDSDYYTGNFHIVGGLKWHNVKWAFQEMFVGNWHPLTWISLMADSSLSGNQPWAPHTTNLLLHALNAGLLFLVLRRLSGAHWCSAWVAAMFAAHPTHVESVAWIAERKDVLSTFFGLLSLWCYCGWLEAAGEKGKGRKYYVGALVWFALSLMSKSMLVTLPCLLLMLDYWPLGRLQKAEGGVKNWRKLVIEKLPFFALTLASCVVTFLAQRSGKAVADLEHLSVWTRLENTTVSYVRYLGKLAWPTDLAIMYPYKGIWPWALVIGALFTLMGLCWAAAENLRRRPHLFIGWFWYMGTMVPVIGLVQVGQQAIADRYLYITSIGIFVALAWSAAELAERCMAWRKPVAAVALGTVLVCGWVTAKQLLYWQSTITVFSHAIAVTEGNFFAHNNLGCDLRNKRRYQEAEEHFKAALKYFPTDADVMNNYGYLYAQQNQFDKAIELYESALQANTNHQSARDNLASALFLTGRTAEARDQYLQILKRYPDQPDTHNQLGVVLANLGQMDDAVPHFKTALKLNPEFAAAHCNLGNVYAARKKFDDAIAEYRAALKLNPLYGEAVNNLGSALEDQGNVKEAMSYYRQAIILERTNPQAHFNLGCLLLQAGQRETAITHIKEAVRLKPNYTKAKKKLEELGSPVGK